MIDVTTLNSETTAPGAEPAVDVVVAVAAWPGWPGR
jgi:hypothetical protein